MVNESVVWKVNKIQINKQRQIIILECTKLNFYNHFLKIFIINIFF